MVAYIKRSSFTFTPSIGARFKPTLTEALKIAREENHLVTYEFNGVIINVQPDSSYNLIRRDFLRACKGAIGPEVGPYPALKLTLEELNHEKIARAEKVRRWKGYLEYMKNHPDGDWDDYWDHIE